MAIMTRLRTGAVLLALGLCLGRAYGEDVLILSNGREARGEIVQETDERVRLRMKGGSLWYARSMIKEIVRGAPGSGDTESRPAATATVGREEYALLYRDGERVGTRVFRVSLRKDHFQFEEERRFAAAEDRPARVVRVVERCDLQFRPLFLQVRESLGEDSHRLTEARVRAGQLVLNAVVDGERKLETSPLPTSARFPLAARELFFREHVALGGKLIATVYDLAGHSWGKVTYQDRGPKRIDVSGDDFNPGVEDVRVLERLRDGVVEKEWLAADGSSRLTELDGESLRAIRATAEAVERALSGEFEDATGADALGAARHGDVKSGWSVGKPDPSWVFQRPPVEGAGALVSVRQEVLSASVDVLHDPVARKGVTIEQAAEALQRLCRSIAPDFRVASERYGEGDYGRDYWLEATATTKGEKTRTLARVVVKDHRVFRLLGACPERWFDLCRADLERILNSLRIE